MPTAFNPKSQAGLANQAYNAVKLGNRKALEMVIKSNNIVSETSMTGNPMFHLYKERYEGGATLLHLAAFSGNLSVVSLLINEKVVGDLAEINNRIDAAKEKKKRDNKNSSIDLDADSDDENNNMQDDGANRVVYVNLLKDALNRYDDTANTPIHMAALSGSVVLFEFMMNSGCDVNKPGHNGNTVFHYAASSGHRKLVDYLIYEALPYATLIMLNHDDQTASMNAIASGYEELGNHIEESLHELRTKLTGKRGGV